MGVAEFIEKENNRAAFAKGCLREKDVAGFGQKVRTIFEIFPNGYFLPSYEVLGEIAEYFGLTLSEFFVRMKSHYRRGRLQKCC